jgi:hypothetical protein
VSCGERPGHQRANAHQSTALTGRAHKFYESSVTRSSIRSG